MKRNHNALIGAIMLAATIVSIESWGQVDAVWLRSWNEAQERQPATITSKARIASDSEVGIPLIIHGRVIAPDGTLAGGVLVHAYHRDADGLEFGANDNSLTTWELQGWARTDANGRFEFRTIRPAPDHLGREGSHIHFTLDSADFGRQWAPKIFFSDDPLVSPHQHQRSTKAGEFAWIRDIRIVDGIQHVDVKFQLKKEADF
jgi:protocatechuate 3,4-dioxygenase beta subunit